MADVLLDFYSPKTFTADEDITAGQVVKVTGVKKVKKVTAYTDVPAGVALLDASSGEIVTVVHGCWVIYSGLTAVGPVEAKTGGGLQAYTSGHVAGFAASTGASGEVFIY